MCFLTHQTLSPSSRNPSRMESMDDFDVAVQTIVKQQTDYKARVKLLQAENEKLRKNLLSLEDQLRTSKNLLNDELTKGERPTKFMRQTSLRSASVVQRLVANAASPRYISEDEEQHIVIHKTQHQQQLEDEEEEEEEQPASEISKKKSRFSLIAHAGDERESISPKTREITLPVLVKSYVEFNWQEEPKMALVMLRPGDEHSISAFGEIAKLLIGKNITIVVESGALENLAENDTHESSLKKYKEKFLYASHEEIQIFPIDFIVCLGGDGKYSITRELQIKFFFIGILKLVCN